MPGSSKGVGWEASPVKLAQLLMCKRYLGLPQRALGEAPVLASGTAQFTFKYFQMIAHQGSAPVSLGWSCRLSFKAE
jgi:hypothetical protein